MFFRHWPVACLGALWLILAGAVALFAATEGGSPVLQERYLYGLVVLEAGSAHWGRPKEAGPGAAIPLGTLLPKGSIVIAGAERGADVRLGTGSVVRLAPGSRVRIQPFALELQQGSLLARHTGSIFPLRIEGGATLLISRDSLVEADRKPEGLTARVQVGSALTPGIPQPVTAGQCLVADGRHARLVPVGPVPRGWGNPILPPAARGTVDGSFLDEGDMTTEEPASPAAEDAAPTAPDAAQPPADQPPPPASDSGGEAVPAEEWMLQPQPADGSPRGGESPAGAMEGASRREGTPPGN